MLTTIQQYVKRLPIFVPIKTSVVHDEVSYYHKEAILQDGRYVSLLVFFTDAFLFGEVVPGIGTGYRERDPYAVISNNLRIFNSKEEFLEGRWDPEKYQGFGMFALEFLSAMFQPLVGFEVGYFCVKSAKVWLRPTPSLMIEYGFGGVMQEPLVFLLKGRVVIQNLFYGSLRDEFRQFVDGLGLEDLFIWDERRRYDDSRRVASESK